MHAHGGHHHHHKGRHHHHKGRHHHHHMKAAGNEAAPAQAPAPAATPQ
jgi:hypothetical protein